MSITSRIISRLMKLPPAESHNILVRRDLKVQMSDGVALLADHYAPREGPKRPTILIRSPYGRAGFFGAVFARPFAERGFQVLIQSCRGTFGSGGTFAPFHQEQADGLATVAWIKTQDWFSGELLTMGPSYLGYVQWAVAPYVGPELKAMVAQVTTSEFASQMHPGGAFTLNDMLTWTHQIMTQEKGWFALIGQTRKLAPALRHLPLCDADALAVGTSVPFFQDFLVHVPGDDWWAPADHSRTVAEVSAPVNMVTGWYDIFLPRLLKDYRTLRVAGKRPYLLIGPWTHAAMPGMAAAAREALPWFRAHLSGDHSALREAPVRLFVMGAKQWRDFPDWPPANVRLERWHLQPNGGLTLAPPPDAAPDHYHYDPANPTPAVGGAWLSGSFGPRDNRPLEARPDVLVYTSIPLQQDLEVIGPVTAELYIRSSLEHTDFFAKLCDVDPSGRSINLCDGILRLAPGHLAPEADGSLHITIELWPTANRFLRGHRVRVQVSSGAHPRFARNLGSGEPLATATTLRTAEQTVYHDPAHPSAIVLPVLQP